MNLDICLNYIGYATKHMGTGLPLQVDDPVNWPRWPKILGRRSIFIRHRAVVVIRDITLIRLFAETSVYSNLDNNDNEVLLKYEAGIGKLAYFFQK